LPTLLGPQALPNASCLAENEATKDGVIAAMAQIDQFIQDVVLETSDLELIANGRDDDAGICAKHLMYSLRHTQHHVGEFVQVLAENGIKPPAWSTANRQ
jgi:hypothetical protein